MKPVKYTTRDGVTHFHYKLSELRDFVKRGLESGDVGMILTRREGITFVYRGFGTLENPSSKIATKKVTHNFFIDGRMLFDYEMLSVDNQIGSTVVFPNNPDDNWGVSHITID